MRAEGRDGATRAGVRKKTARQSAREPIRRPRARERAKGALSAAQTARTKSSHEIRQMHRTLRLRPDTPGRFATRGGKARRCRRRVPVWRPARRSPWDGSCRLRSCHIRPAHDSDRSRNPRHMSGRAVRHAPASSAASPVARGPAARRRRGVGGKPARGESGREPETLSTRAHAKKFQSFTWRSRSAFTITLTELTLIAAPASMGLSNAPSSGYSAPAAIGTPRAL